MHRMDKINSYGISTPSNIVSSTSSNSFSDAQKADYEISGPFAYLKQHLNFIQVVFSVHRMQKRRSHGLLTP
jgi:hypothetical protein